MKRHSSVDLNTCDISTLYITSCHYQTENIFKIKRLLLFNDIVPIT